MRTGGAFSAFGTEIRPRKLHNENKIREWQEKYPDVFKAGMGAEAMLEILKDLELETVRESLQSEINSSSGHRCRGATMRTSMPRRAPVTR